MKRKYNISVKEAYELAGRQAKRLAKIVGVNPRTIRGWIEGRRTPTPEHYNKLVSGALALYAEREAKAAGARGGEIYSGQRRDVWRRYLTGRRKMSPEIVQTVAERLLAEKQARGEHDLISEILRKLMIPAQQQPGIMSEIMIFAEYLAHMLEETLWKFPRKLRHKIDKYKRLMHSSDFFIEVKYKIDNMGIRHVKNVRCAKNEKDLKHEA